MTCNDWSRYQMLFFHEKIGFSCFHIKMKVHMNLRHNPLSKIYIFLILLLFFPQKYGAALLFICHQGNMPSISTHYEGWHDVNVMLNTWAKSFLIEGERVLVVFFLSFKTFKCKCQWLYMWIDVKKSEKALTESFAICSVKKLRVNMFVINNKHLQRIL